MISKNISVLVTEAYDFLQLLSKPVLNTIDNDSEGLSKIDQEYYLSAWCREWELLHIRLLILKNPFYLPTCTLTPTGHSARLVQKTTRVNYTETNFSE